MTKEIVTGRTGVSWEIEYPCECNGRMTDSMGFVTPLGDNGANSDFFIRYSDGRMAFYSYFPKYVTDAATKLAGGAR